MEQDELDELPVSVEAPGDERPREIDRDAAVIAP
jgi:hypothetical protein